MLERQWVKDMQVWGEWYSPDLESKYWSDGFRVWRLRGNSRSPYPWMPHGKPWIDDSDGRWHFIDSNYQETYVAAYESKVPPKM